MGSRSCTYDCNLTPPEYPEALSTSTWRVGSGALCDEMANAAGGVLPSNNQSSHLQMEMPPVKKLHTVQDHHNVNGGSAQANTRHSTEEGKQGIASEPPVEKSAVAVLDLKLAGRASEEANGMR